MARVDVLSDSEWLEAARQYLEIPESEIVMQKGVRPAREKGKSEIEEEEEITGFVGDGLAVKVSVRRANGTMQEAALFLKTVPTGDPQRERIALETKSFEKEGGVYARLFPLMRAAAPAAKPWAPRCFLVRPTLLVFEDLRGVGFEPPGNAYTMSYEECRAALDTMAHFHAAAIALDHQMRASGQSFHERFQDLLQENMLSPIGGGGLFKYFLRSTDVIAHLASLLPATIASPHGSAVRRRTPQLLVANTLRLVAPSSRFRNTLCHGDIWISNMMLRKHPKAEVRLVDFQLCRWAPPAQDVEVLLHTCTRQVLRDQRGLELRAGYHSALRQALRAAGGLQVESLLPWEEFLASCEEQRPLGRVIAASFHSNDLLPAADLRAAMQPSGAAGAGAESTLLLRDRVPLADAAFKNDPCYRERLTEDVLQILQQDIFPVLENEATPGAA